MKPYRETIQQPMTDAEIVAGLRGSDPELFGRALQQLAGEAQRAVYVRADVADGQVMFAAAQLEAPGIFTLLLVIAQQIGQALGMRLDWVRDNRQKQPQLIIPHPRSGPFK